SVSRSPSLHPLSLHDALPIFDHDLIGGGHGGNLPCTELDVFQVGRHALTLTVGLGGGVHRDEDHVGSSDGTLHIGGEEQVAAAGFGNDGIQPRLVHGKLGEVLVVPCRDAGGVDIHNRNGDVRAFLGNHRHGGAANVAGSDAAYVFYCHRVSELISTGEKGHFFSCVAKIKNKLSNRLLSCGLFT